MLLSISVNRQAGAAVLLLAVSVLAVALWWRPATQPGADEGRKVAEDFLTLIHEGHPDQAWSATTAEFKSARGKEAFIRDVKQHSFLKEPLQFFAVSTVDVQNQPRSEYLFRAANGQSKTDVRIVLGREDGQWKVDLCVFPEAK